MNTLRLLGSGAALAAFGSLSYIVAAAFTVSHETRLATDIGDKPVPVWSAGTLIVIDQNGSKSPALDLFDDLDAA
jgi:hypothetical protein